MADTGDQLRAASDALLSDLDRLEALEREKRQLDPGDSRTVTLAAEIEDIARRVLGRTVQQHRLTAIAREQVDRGSPDAPDAPIGATPREIHLILADWRDAERRVQAAGPGSEEAATAAEDVERFRNEYRAAHDAARRTR